MAKAAASLLTEPRLSWPKVADLVSRRVGNGKKYSGQYVREVARGWRTHKKIEPILRELGLMSEQAVAA